MLRPQLAGRFRIEACFILNRFLAEPSQDVETVEVYTLAFIDPLLARLHEWMDARMGLSDDVVPLIHDASLMRACYAFRKVSEEEVVQLGK